MACLRMSDDHGVSRVGHTRLATMSGSVLSLGRRADLGTRNGTRGRRMLRVVLILVIFGRFETAAEPALFFDRVSTSTHEHDVQPLKARSLREVSRLDDDGY